MSRTRSSSRNSHASCHTQPSANTALPDAFVADMEDQLLGMGDVLDSYDLLASLMDPLERTRTLMDGVDEGKLSACMRILNNEHHTRLRAARNLLVTRRLNSEPS